MCQEDRTRKPKKERRRNAEKRKEKSRDAARSRRGKEAIVFAELSSLIPVPSTTVATLDKASMMRLCISYLKLRSLGGDQKLKIESSGKDKKIEQQYLKSLNGFVIAVDKDGDLVYVSDNVIKHLGITQIDLIGQNIYEYSHPCDHDEIKEVLGQKHGDKQKTEETFFARMKCTLTSKGRNVNLKSATYKVIRFRGHHLANKTPECWAFIGETIPHPSHIDVPLDSFSFLTRHSMDMKFTYCDERVEELLGYDPEEVIGTPLYEFHHALDGEYMDKTYKNLFSKGQVWTDHYRFLASGGGYAWVETQATVVYNTKTDKPQSVLCVHYMISGVEDADSVMSAVQMFSVKQHQSKKALSASASVSKKPSRPSYSKGPVLSTESVCAAQPEQINRGVCPPKRKLKEEQDYEMSPMDARGGEEIIPLSFDGQDGDMMTLLSDILLQGSDVDLTSKKETSFNRTAENETENKKYDIPNLEHLVDKRCMNIPSEKMMTSEFDIEDIDMELRAPYIPMSGEDDLMFSACIPPVPLVGETDDGPKQMLGITETIFNPKQDTVEDEEDRKFIIPMSLLRQESINLKEKQYREMEHIKVNLKQRQPVETNRLETGPPAKKACYMDVDSDVESVPSPLSIDISNIRHSNIDVNSIVGSSVLKNLLLSGQDKANGYDLYNINRRGPENKKIPESGVLRELLTSPLSSSSSCSSSSMTISPPRSPVNLSLPKYPPTASPASSFKRKIDYSSKYNSPAGAQITIRAVSPKGEANGQSIVLTEEILQLLTSFAGYGKGAMQAN